MSRRSTKRNYQPDRSRETRQDVLLTVAAVLPSPFRFEDLVVAAWQARPALFGLKTYPYPNSNAVLPRVYGTHGLVTRGYLKQVSVRLLEITEAGRSKLAKMGFMTAEEERAATVRMIRRLATHAGENVEVRKLFEDLALLIDHGVQHRKGDRTVRRSR